ncbi:MAG: type I-B CRISPR-associated protein Cas7/Cst2/DevR [Thermoplasmata archaeon]
MSETNTKPKGKKYIVMDIVFYGSSLNYDQGAGNYQELKKITKWDGKQYSFVSRYALRYSILKTGEDLGFWRNAPGDALFRAGEGDKTVIQPSPDALLSGEILIYPEFDLFGYLITSTSPQNNKEAPVKISHAISMTPFNYDSHFGGNLWLAKRMVEAGKVDKMDPNLFTVEEHQTYYIYTVIIDVDRIGKTEVFLAKKGDSFLGMENQEREEAKEEESPQEEGKKKKKSKEKIIGEIKIENNKIFIKIEGKNKGDGEKSSLQKEIPLAKYQDNKYVNATVRDIDKDSEIFCVSYWIDNNEIKNRIKNLIKSILYLNRTIKGRNEVLHPKLLILGIYNDAPYQSFKDRITLVNEYEEVYEETTEINESNQAKETKNTMACSIGENSEKKETRNTENPSSDNSENTDETPENPPEKTASSNMVKIIRRVVKLQKPIFKIFGPLLSDSKLELIDVSKITELVDSVLFSDKNSSQIHVFHAPEIKEIVETSK